MMPKTPKQDAVRPVKRKRYSKESLELAIKAVKNGMSKKLASKTYGVPRSTIQFKQKNPNSKQNPGPPTVLFEDEEKQLVEWLQISSRKGFPKRKEDLIESVGDYITKADRKNPFKNSRPGEKWYSLFLKRHPELSIRTPEAVTSASSCVSESDVRKWFADIESYLKESEIFNILEDPSRVFNGDETNFQLCPKTGVVLATKGERNVYEVDRGQAKSSLTVMFTFGANGDITPPMVIFPNKRLPKNITDNIPDSWGIGLTDNGWMKADAFIEYIKRVFHPYLIKTNRKFPVILFVDGHTTHLTLDLSKLCTELGIELIALYPNSTRILQPADVAAFKPLKNAWKKCVLEWRQENPSKALTKVDFAPILQKSMKHLSGEAIKNGFKATGLYPWNPDNVDYTKCLGKIVKNGGDRKNEGSRNTENEKKINKETFLKLVGEEKLKNILMKPYSSECERILKKLSDFLGIKVTELKSTEGDIINMPLVFEGDIEAKEFRSTDDDMPNACLIALPNETLDGQLVDNESIETSEIVMHTPLKVYNLKDMLPVPKTPERKGLKNIVRTSYVLTSSEWKKKEEEKKYEKECKQKAIQKRKEERLEKKKKLETKEKKEKKAKTAKRCAVEKKLATSSVIPESKRIKVLSDIKINIASASFTKSSETKQKLEDCNEFQENFSEANQKSENYRNESDFSENSNDSVFDKVLQSRKKKFTPSDLEELFSLED